MTVKHWGGEVGIVWFNAHIPCSGAWDTMISYMALISTPGTTRGKVLANLAPNGIKKKMSPQVELILVDNKRWNKIDKNRIKFIEVAKEWMHGCVMENVQIIKIKLENIWIDLIRSISALYTSNIWGIAWANNPTGISNCTRYQKVSIARSRDCFSISNRGSWLPWSNNMHGTQHIRRKSGRQPWWFSCHADEIEYKSPWRIIRELRSWSVQDICRRNTAMAKATWPTRC